MTKGLDVVLFRGSTGPKVDRHVFGGGLEPIQSVAQVLPVSPADDDLVGTQVTPLRFAASLVGPLSVRRAAVALRAPRPTGSLERSPTPGAMSYAFRHSDGTLPHGGVLSRDQTSRRPIRYTLSAIAPIESTTADATARQ